MNPAQRTGEWMQTASGRQFFPLEVRPEDIDIEDIAHALSNLCRFGGHCRQFYSVAQHSVYVSALLPREAALAGLLHDATEAYLVDLPRPLKRLMPQYKVVEESLAAVIAAKFKVSLDDPRVHHADQVALMTEARDLLGPRPASWGFEDVPVMPDPIIAKAPAEAREQFLNMFRLLTSTP